MGYIRFLEVPFIIVQTKVGERLIKAMAIGHVQTLHIQRLAPLLIWVIYHHCFRYILAGGSDQINLPLPISAISSTFGDFNIGTFIIAVAMMDHLGQQL